jgi:hypothetical protein
MRSVCAGISLIFAGVAFADPVMDRITVSQSFPMGSTTGMDLVSGTVTCPDETILLTGGAKVLADNGGIPSSVPLFASTPQGNGWTAYARETADLNAGNVNLIISAVCGIVTNSFSPHLRIEQATATLNRNTAGLDFASASAECPSGFNLISGGASLMTSAGNVPVQVALVRNRPVGNGWYALGREIVSLTASSVTLTVKAVCADGASGLSAPTAATATGAFPDVAGTLDIGSATAACPAGKSSLGGGTDILLSNGAVPPLVAIMSSEPSGTTGWFGRGREMIDAVQAPLTLNATAVAQCLTLTGVTGLTTVSRAYSLPNSPVVMDAVSGHVQCPAGKTMLGGGARILASNNGVPASMALVSTSAFGNGWAATARETADVNRSTTVLLTVSAVCAVLPP